MAASTTGFAFQATAIATGRLVVVAPLNSMNVLVALFLSARHAGRPLGPREWSGGAAAVVGVAGFLIVAAPKEGVDVSPVVPVGRADRGPDRSRRPRGAGRPAPCAARAVGSSSRRWPACRSARPTRSIKVFTEVGSDHGFGGVVSHWGIYTWFVVSPCAFLLQQSAFHSSHLGAAMPATSTLAPTTASILGALMFGETLRGGWAVPVELALFGLMLFGVFLLSSSPLIDAATDEDLDPAPA